MAISLLVRHLSLGGGGKIHGYTESLAGKLDIVPERVALRGEEVMKNIIFEQEGIKKDPLLVTPIGALPQLL